MRLISLFTAILIFISSSIAGMREFATCLVQSADLPAYDSTPPMPELGMDPRVDPIYRGATWDDSSLASLLTLQGIEDASGAMPEAPPADRLTSDILGTGGGGTTGGGTGGVGGGGGTTGGGTTGGGTTGGGTTGGGTTGGGTTGGGTSGGGTGSPPTSGTGGALPGESFGPGGGSSHAEGSVNTHTGNRITTVPIVGWSGLSGIQVDFSLIHNSQTSGAAGNGVKWRTSFDTVVHQDSSMAPTGAIKHAIVRMADGTAIPFTETAVGTQMYRAPTSGYKWLLTRKPYGETYGWRLRFDDQSADFFDDHGYLLEMRNRNGASVFISRVGASMSSIYDSGHTLTLSRRTDGIITGVTDPIGRTWTFSYNASNYLTGVTYPALSGTTYTRSFGYNTRADITSETDLRGKLWNCAYDTSDRLTTWTDPTARACTYTYSGAYTSFTLPHLSTASTPYLKVTHNYSAGLLASAVDPAGFSVTYAWDTGKNATSVKDENGNTTLYTYDSLGNVLTVQKPHLTNPLMHTTVVTTTYNALSDLQSAIDALGHVRTYDYDSLGYGKLLHEYFADFAGSAVNTMATYGYDGYHQVNAVSSISSRSVGVAYDSSGNVSSLTPGGGATLTVGSDGLGRPTSVARMGRGTTSVAYDDWGRAAIVTNSDSSTSSATYDLEDNVVAATDENGHTGYVTYDDAGRPLSSTNARGDTSSVGYDDYGRVVSVTNGRGKTRNFVLGPRGERLKMTLPDAYTEEYTYDGNGNLKVFRDARTRALLQTTNYAYDKWDRLTTTTYPGGGTATMSYDLINNPTSMVDSSGTTTWQYDSSGRLLNLITSAGTVHYGYDTHWRRNSLTQPGLSTATSFTYDGYGRLATLTNPFSETTSWTYDVVSGDLTRQTMANGAYTDYGFDIRGRVSTITHKTSTSGVIDPQTYTYDPAGNLITKTVAGDMLTYTYDAIDQLTSEGSIVYGGISYTYDGNGNRLTRTQGSTTENYTYDNADKLLSIAVGSTTTRSYTYDAAGRPFSITSSSGTRTLAFDDEDRLTSISGTGAGTYTYNAAGTRVSKTVGSTTRNYVRSGAGVTAPVLADGAATYTPGISEHRGSTSSFVHGDHLGSTTRLTNSSQATTDTRDTDAFGNLRGSTGSNPSPFGFAGGFGYQGDETGLMLLGHRYYDASAGRFLTRDPAQAGSNWFGYCKSNPGMHVDPTGLLGGDVPEVAVELAADLADTSIVGDGVEFTSAEQTLLQRAGWAATEWFSSLPPDVQRVLVKLLEFLEALGLEAGMGPSFGSKAHSAMAVKIEEAAAGGVFSSGVSVQTEVTVLNGIVMNRSSYGIKGSVRYDAVVAFGGKVWAVIDWKFRSARLAAARLKQLLDSLPEDWRGAPVVPGKQYWHASIKP